MYKGNKYNQWCIKLVIRMFRNNKRKYWWNKKLLIEIYLLWYKFNRKLIENNTYNLR